MCYTTKNKEIVDLLCYRKRFASVKLLCFIFTLRISKYLRYFCGCLKLLCLLPIPYIVIKCMQIIYICYQMATINRNYVCLYSCNSFIIGRLKLFFIQYACCIAKLNTSFCSHVYDKCLLGKNVSSRIFYFFHLYNEYVYIHTCR